MKKTMLAIAVGLMASTTAAQAGGLLPRLQPVTAAVTGLTAPALSGLSGSVQPKEGEPRFGLPAFPDLALPDLPYIDVPTVPGGPFYGLESWLEYTVNVYPRHYLGFWATGVAGPAAWDELDIALGMAAAGDIGGFGNRMLGFGGKIPAPPQPYLPSELSALTPTYNTAWDATVGTVFGEAWAP